jgi:hypothetical protein
MFPLPLLRARKMFLDFPLGIRKRKRAVVDAKNLKTHHLVLDQRMFFWASYVVGQDIDEVWWPTASVSGYKRGPECRKNSTCT